MQFVCDKTGFPLVVANGLTLSLLPVTKLQFERFLSEPLGLSSIWYQQVLALNPRRTVRTVVNSERERLFITGVTFQEAGDFANWLHPHGRLPQQAEWQNFAVGLKQTVFSRIVEKQLLSCGMSEAATAVLKRLIGFIKPANMAELALIRGGLLEWVSHRQGYGGLGAPRPAFFSNTFDPYHDQPMKHFADERSPFYGLRVLVGEETF